MTLTEHEQRKQFIADNLDFLTADEKEIAEALGINKRECDMENGRERTEKDSI